MSVQKLEKTSCVWKNYIWNPSTYTCENDKCLVFIIGDLLITCDEIREVTKAVPIKTTSTNFSEKK